ncbi:major facilitator superfamily domain-containing protein [Mycena polygramma]|nr:major facilitator superfamily domain-containing protein [Mycena polygramma]
MDYTIDPTVFASYWEFALSQAYGAYTAVLFYGILLVLVCIAAPLLYHRAGAGRRTLVLATTAMAILGTAQVIIHIYTAAVGFRITRLAIEGDVWPSAAALGATSLYASLYTARDFLLAANNVVTDSVFIYRCFVIWRRNGRIVALPLLMLIATTVLGFLLAYEDDLATPYHLHHRIPYVTPVAKTLYHLDCRLPYLIVVATNVLLMGLTAGRIWWIRRDASLVLESAHVRRYNTAIAIIILRRCSWLCALVWGRSAGDTTTEPAPPVLHYAGTPALGNTSSIEVRAGISSVVMDIGAAYDNNSGTALGKKCLVIYPFVVQFVRDTGVTGGDETKTGFYAGMLESSFFLAEALTVYQFGRLSDRYGRRPILLLAPLGLGISMLGFGLARTFWMLLSLRFIQGAFNGNLGVAKTAMNEISDPVGATLSPFIGGVLANPAAKWPDTLGKIELLRSHPYFLPCAVSASIAFSSFAFACFGLHETLPSAVERARRRKDGAPSETDPLLSDRNAAFSAAPETVLPLRKLLTRPVCIALLNYGLLCFGDMAYDALLPLVCATPIGFGGLGLKPYDIGLMMGLVGVSNAIIQAFLGGGLIRYFGARRIMNAAFCALVAMFALYPLLTILARRAGRVDGPVIAVLVFQLGCNTMIYFALAAMMLFVMDSAPNRANVGAVTGLSQMVGTVPLVPAFTSSLFALSTKHNLAGGHLVYIVLILIACCGLRCSLLLPHHLRSESKRLRRGSLRRVVYVDGAVG